MEKRVKMKNGFLTAAISVSAGLVSILCCGVPSVAALTQPEMVARLVLSVDEETNTSKTSDPQTITEPGEYTFEVSDVEFDESSFRNFSLAFDFTNSDIELEDIEVFDFSVSKLIVGNVDFEVNNDVYSIGMYRDGFSLYDLVKDNSKYDEAFQENDEKLDYISVTILLKDIRIKGEQESETTTTQTETTTTQTETTTTQTETTTTQTETTTALETTTTESLASSTQSNPTTSSTNSNKTTTTTSTTSAKATTTTTNKSGDKQNSVPTGDTGVGVVVMIGCLACGVAGLSGKKKKD